jgi:D-serine deaminase-like pyridoxal phosphate-dependent protein
VAEQERAAATRAAEALRAAGHAIDIVSVGSSPGALNARGMAGVTEVRAGVYMFQDLMQATIGACQLSDLACTVLASVIKVKSDDSILIDAGALALSADKGFGDSGFGRVALLDGTPTDGIVQRVWQEHGLVSPIGGLSVGDKVRVLPVHVCHTAAGHGRYLLTEGSTAITGAWARMGGW